MGASLKFVGATIDESGMGVMTFKVSGALPALSIGEVYVLASKAKPVSKANGHAKPKQQAGVKPITDKKEAALDRALAIVQKMKAKPVAKAKAKGGGRPTNEDRIQKWMAANAGSDRMAALVALNLPEKWLAPPAV